MKLLDTKQCAQVSGADLVISLTAKIPTADTNVFLGLLASYLQGQLDAKSLATALMANSANFNDMQVQNITVGNYAITQAPAPCTGSNNNH
jgi:hypothetical protein